MPSAADLPDQVEAVLTRHPQVADQDVWARFGELLDRFARTGRREYGGADLFQHHDEDTPGIGLVVDDEQAQPVETDKREMSGNLGSILCPRSSSLPALAISVVLSDPYRADGKAYGKRRPFALARALGFNRPAMRFDDVFDDGQSQPNPPNLRRVLLSACRNGSKMRGNTLD